MNILAFADLHGDLKKFERVKEKAEEADIILCAGDLTVFESNLEEFLAKLNSLNKYSLHVHGNHEGDLLMAQMAAKYKYVKFIHRKVFRFKGLLFFGWGGGGFTEYDAAFDKKRAEFDKLLKNKDFVLMTHQPPFDTTLDFVHGSHVGSKSYRKFIEQLQPRIAVSGHIHDTVKAQDRIGKTFIINPGPDGVLLKLK